MNKVASVIMIVLLVVGLIAVRYFEVFLFQDPLNTYFHGDFQNYDIPALSKWKVVLSTSFRYLINLTLSGWIIWFLYKKQSLVNAALWVYLLAYGILILSFFFLLNADSDLLKMALFYVRRFLIHPILLFVLVAGFYFLKNKEQIKTI